MFVKALETTSVTNSSRKPEKCLGDLFTSLPATRKTSKLEQQIATEISLRSGNPSVVVYKVQGTYLGATYVVYSMPVGMSAGFKENHTEYLERTWKMRSLSKHDSIPGEMDHGKR